MDIGVPKEIMDMEFRVAMVPAGVNTLVKAGHRVFVEKNAGAGSGFTDAQFEQAGPHLDPQDPAHRVVPGFLSGLCGWLRGGQGV